MIIKIISTVVMAIILVFMTISTINNDIVGTVFFGFLLIGTLIVGKDYV